MLVFRDSSLSFFLAAVSCLSIAACNSGTITVKQPAIDAARAGKMAMEMYDTNGDGVVSGVELEHAPGLKAALGNLDTDGDKGVSAEEGTARVNAWKAMKTGTASARCHVTLDGEPLPSATVTFEPEQFLGDEIKTAIGTTNPFGDVVPSIPIEQRPDPKMPSGAHFGLYKVRISKIVNGKETIPSRYNSETILGQEISYDDPGLKKLGIVYSLTSKQ